MQIQEVMITLSLPVSATVSKHCGGVPTQTFTVKKEPANQFHEKKSSKNKSCWGACWNFPRSFNILSRNPPHTVAPTLSEPTPELCREPSRNLMQLYFRNLSENCPTGLDCLRPHTILLLANYTTDAIFAFIPKLQSHLGVFFCL